MIHLLINYLMLQKGYRIIEQLQQTLIKCIAAPFLPWNRGIGTSMCGKNNMNNDLKDKRNCILGLLINCPFQKALSDCPAKEIRKLSTMEKFEMVGNMSEQELDTIIGHHEKCSHKRSGVRDRH